MNGKWDMGINGKRIFNGENELSQSLILFCYIRGERERSPPLPQIVHPSLPHLGRSQGSTKPIVQWQGLTLGERPSRSALTPVPGKYA